MDSPAAAAWRAHCQSCPDCRTEQFLLDTLQRQAQSERQHLGQRELAELLAAARQCQERRRRVAPAKAWAWRLASVCLLATITWHLGRTFTPRPSPAPAYLSFAGEAPGAASGNYGVPLYSAGSAHDGAVRQGTNPALPAPLPDLVPGQFVQDLLLNLRDEMDERRQELIELQDRDAGGWERDDAWECVLPANLAVV
jgi:hypothetical protein